MSQERIVETGGPGGATTTHTTVIDDRGSGSSGAGWLVAVVLAIALGFGIYFFAGMSGSEAAKNDAIAGAAKDVGAAAQQVGDAAQTAADKVSNN